MAGPKAIKLAINAFKPGELQGELLQPARGGDLHCFRLAGPASSFDTFDRNIYDFDNPSTGAKEGIHFIENRSVYDVGLEEDESFVAFGREGAVGDEQFVENVEFTKVAECSS